MSVYTFALMNVCGVDLDKNEARLVVMAARAGGFELVDTEVTRLGLSDPKDQGEVRALMAALQSFFDDNVIDVVAIRERLSKGRMKGGTITFKLEGLIQLCRQPVTLISPASIRKSLAAANIDFAELPIAKYQHEAYGAAYCMIQMQPSE